MRVRILWKEILHNGILLVELTRVVRLADQGIVREVVVLVAEGADPLGGEVNVARRG